ncbi:MAG TPA: branched-chain amino acid ABC transporter permease [Candidatus Thermoplasmatota archaeon]
MADLSLLPQLLVNGLVIGSILAIAGIGLSLVYGILKLANFAHGDLVILGAFLAFLFAVPLSGALEASGAAVGASLLAFLLLDLLWLKRLGLGERLVLLALGAPLVALGAFLVAGGRGGTGTTDLVLVQVTLLSAVFSVAALLAMDRLMWRPLRRKQATLLSLVIVSIGVSLVVRNGLQMAFGTGNRSFDRPTAVSPEVFGVLISEAQQAALVATVVVFLAVHLFLSRTRTGKAMRAMADNLELARISGVDVNREVMHVWVLCGLLTALSGVLLALINNNVMHVNMGLALLLPLFASVILGGIGSPYGAMAGGFVVGIAMKTAGLWIGTRYEVAAALIVLIAVLLLRPQGIFGGRVA